MTSSSDLQAARESVLREHFESENRHDFEATLGTFRHPRYEIVPTGADAFTDLVAAHVAQGITKFVLVPVSRPASWAGELAWLAPLVRNFEVTA